MADGPTQPPSWKMFQGHMPRYLHQYRTTQNVRQFKDSKFHSKYINIQKNHSNSCSSKKHQFYSFTHFHPISGHPIPSGAPSAPRRCPPRAARDWNPRARSWRVATQPSGDSRRAGHVLDGKTAGCLNPGWESMGILIFMANLFGFYGDFIVINGTVYDDSWYCLWWLTENFWDWIKTYGDTIKICMQQKWWRCDGGIIGISTCNYCNEIWVGHGLYRCTLQLTILRRTIKKWWSVGIGLAKGVVFCENGIFLTDFFCQNCKNCVYKSMIDMSQS